MDARPPSGARWRWLRSAGEAARAIRECDWSDSPLAAPSAWPQSLRTALSLVLSSPEPMLLWWGPEFLQFHNDAALAAGWLLNTKSVGQPAHRCWGDFSSTLHGPLALTLQSATEAVGSIPVPGGSGAVHLRYSAVIGESDQVVAVIGQLDERDVDATRRFQVDASRLEHFLDQAPAAICIVRGPDLVFEFANSQYQQLVRCQQLLGKRLQDALPELTGQGFDDLLKQVMRTQETYVGREVLVKLGPENEDGARAREVYCTFIYSPLKNRAGATDGVAAFVLDVTAEVQERRRGEELSEKLRRSDAEFRTLAESIPQLAWSARPDGWIDWYNRRWYEYTGTTLAEMQGWGWSRVHKPEILPDVEKRWKSALAGGVDFEMEFPLRRGDGVYRWHLTRAVPLRGTEGEIVRWFGTNTDIDDAKRAQAERAQLLANAEQERANAEAASREKDEFLAIASHELRTPLNAILGWARLLRKDELEVSFLRKGLDVIERNAHSQVRLIEDLLDGARILNGKLQLDLHQVDLARVVRLAVDAVKPVADVKGQTVASEVTNEPAYVLGDAERLQQVTANLLNNAIKFSPAASLIEVTLRSTETELELSVVDHGEGIEPGFLPHVFERFRQAESSSTRKHGGLGLGLALVRHLTELHGGHVLAESEGVGRGARFTVRLPRSDFNPADSAPPPGHARSGEHQALNLRGVQALVVDDDPDARELVALVLTGAGAEVRVAANAKEGLTSVLGGELPDILLSDVGMPGTDGYELLRLLRKQHGISAERLPAIALTAYAREDDRRRALDAGFQAHIAKPVDAGLLIRSILRLRRRV